MGISNKSRARIGLPPRGDDSLASALGVQSSTMLIHDKVELSKAEQELLQSRALTVEDDPWNQLPNERRVNLIQPVYGPVTLANLVLQNNTLGQCVDAMETNIDGSGYDIERRDGKTPEDLKAQAEPPVAPPAAPNPFDAPKKPNPFAKPEGAKPNPFAKVEGFAPTPEEDGDERNIKTLKAFFDEAFINESFLSIRRKLRRDMEVTGNGYLEVIRNQSGEITLINCLDAKLVRLVKLDAPVEVEKTINRNGSEQTIRMAVRERRFAQMIGNKVRYFREFGSSREVNSETGEWMGPAKKAPPSRITAPKVPEFQATNDFDKVPKDPLNPNPDAEPMPGDVTTESGSPDELEAKRKKKVVAFKADDTRREFPGVPDAKYSTAPKPEDDPTKRPEHEEQQAGLPGTEIIHIRVKPDITTPYGVPRWINQVPSVLGSRKAEELNLEYFNHGGLPPVMIFLQGGQLSPVAKTELNKYLSGEAKTKMRGVVADVYATGGDLTSNSQVKVNVERFGGDRLNDSMFEGYDERCSGRVRSAFRLPPLFTGDTQDYTFATAYASYVVAEAQVFKPERELFDEVINNTIMKELAPDYVYRSLPLTVHDVAVQLQAMTLAKDVTDRKTFVDELNEIAGLNLTFQDPLTDPMNPMAGLMGGVPGQDNPFGGEDQDTDGAGADKPPFGQEEAAGGKPNPFAAKGKVPSPVGGPKVPAAKPKRPLPSGFAKAEGVMKDDILLKLANDWAAHLSGDRQFEAPTLNVMQSMIGGLHPVNRKLFNALVGTKLAPGAQYDPEGVADLIACAGSCLHQ